MTWWNFTVLSNGGQCWAKMVFGGLIHNEEHPATYPEFQCLCVEGNWDQTLKRTDVEICKEVL